MIIHNVVDRHASWIGSWRVEPLVYSRLKSSDVGRKIVYCDSSGRAEVGILTSWRDGRVYARYSHGDTAAGSQTNTLWWAVSRADTHPDSP